MLCLNVSAGVGVIGMASPKLQEIFGGELIGLPGVGFAQLSAEERTLVATIAAGFAGFLSLFDIGGRFFLASLSAISVARRHTIRSSSSASHSTRRRPGLHMPA